MTKSSDVQFANFLDVAANGGGQGARSSDGRSRDDCQPVTSRKWRHAVSFSLSFLWHGLFNCVKARRACHLLRCEARSIRSGSAMGAPDFAWSTLALEIVDPDPAAVSSYLLR